MKQTRPNKIQAQGYKHICPFCECDENGASCKKLSYKWSESYGNGEYLDYWYHVDGTRCSFNHGRLCQYYKENYYPKLKTDE